MSTSDRDATNNPSRNAQASTSSNPILAPESPNRRDLASHTRIGIQHLSRASEKHRQQSTSYRPRLTSSALFNTPTTSDDQPGGSESGSGSGTGQKRDDRLALCEMDEEELEKRRGPRFFHSPEGDEDWIKVDPNSAIRLKSRSLPHSSVQGLLTGRLHLPPSLLYSIVRPQFNNPNKKFRGKGGGGGSDLYVPVMGEWVTIGVLVEKSPIRMSQSPSDLIEEEEDEEESDDDEANSDSSQQQTQNKKRKRGKQTNSRPRKFISFKFIDLGHGSYSSTSNSITSNVSSGRNSLRGDSVLNLIMFEASRSSRGTSDNLGNRGGISETVYTGGSGGAFEKWAKETEGAVVAIVNPRILPLQKDKSSVGQILTMSPNTASSIHLIGRSADYGQCQAMKKDGNRCGGFADKRTSNGICEWHLENALEKNKSKGGRGEFSNSTGHVTTLGNPSGSSSGSKWKGGNSMSHFKVVKQEKPDFGTSFPKIKQEPGIKKGAISLGYSSTKGMEGMQAPRAYHVEHASSRNFDPNNPTAFVAGLGEASLPRSHIKASNPQSLLFDVTERYGRGKAEKEERMRQREKNEEVLLRLLERKAAGEEDEVLLREERQIRGELGNDDGVDGLEEGVIRQERRTQDDSDKKREFDQDGTEIIRKRKKIVSTTDQNRNSRPPQQQQIDADGNQSSIFMADSTQAITTGGKAIREAQLEIKKRKEKAEKLRLEKLPEKEDRKKGIKSKKTSYINGNNSNVFARNSDASFDRELHSVLTSRTVTNEVYEKNYNDEDDLIRPGDFKKLKRRKRETTPPYANVRKGGNLRNHQAKEKRSMKEKEKEDKRIARNREKGIAVNRNDSGSDLETDSGQDDDYDSLDDIFDEPERKEKSKGSANVSASSSSLKKVKVRKPIDVLRTSSQESSTDSDEEELQIDRSKDKGKGKEREMNTSNSALCRSTVPALDVDFSEDSELEIEMEEEPGSKAPTSAQRASNSSNSSASKTQGPPPPKKFAHSIDAVKKMGFDPLAGARGFDRRRLDAENGTQVNDGSDVKSRLLARLAASADSLPKPVLNSSNSRSRSNLSAMALKSSREAKEKRIKENLKLRLAQRKDKGRETRVGSDSEESGDEESLRDPLLDLDLNLQSQSQKRRKELDEDGLEIDEDVDDWNSELEEEMQRAEKEKEKIEGKKKPFVVHSEDENENENKDASSDLELY